MAPFDDEPFMLTSGPATAGYSAKDEMNFAEFPIALVTDRADKSMEKTLRFEDKVFDVGKNQYVTRRLVITASDEYGLPTAKDDEVILGLLQLTRHENDFTSRTVSFSRSDLIRLLAWPDTGPSYRRLSLSFNRWLGVSLHYHNAWWDKSQDRWTTLGFHIIESFALTGGSRTRGQSELPLCRFTWNEDVFKSFQAGYLKRLDLDFYLGLTLPTAKRIYRFLDKRFYHRSAWTFDLKEFALDHVGLSRGYEGNTQLSRKLLPAIRELEEKGFLVPMELDRRFQKHSTRDWKVVLIRQGGAEAAEVPPRTPGGDTSGLVSALTERGVTGKTAEELAAAYPDRILPKVEVFDWLRVRKDRRIQKSPAGFLVNSVRKNYEDPNGFESAAEKARVREMEFAKARLEKEVKRRREEEEAIREARDRVRAAAYWNSLDPESQERLWHEALEQGDPFFVQQYRRLHRTGGEGGQSNRDFILAMHILKVLNARGA
jgi:hypothetical protein